MLQYKEGRFHFAGVSFAIPDGFFLDTGYNFQFEGFAIVSPDEKVAVEIGFDEGRKDPKADLEHYFEPGSESDLDIRKTIEPTEVNGLKGYLGTYISLDAAFIEYRLTLPRGGLLWLTVKQEGATVEELRQSQHLAAVLEGITASRTNSNSERLYSVQ